MSARVLQGRMTVCRNNRDEIHIEIEDEVSRVRFFDGRMSVEDFGMMITGMACKPITFEARGVEYIGKRKVSEPRCCECPAELRGRENMEAWLRANKQEPGWILDSYLGSQSSVSHRDGKTQLRYGVTKYVDEEARE